MNWFDMEWYNYVGLTTLLNWHLCFIISWIYVLWLWHISGDIKFEGWVRWRFFIPIARFRLISTKSWYAKLWAKFYGFGGLLLIMIHRDEAGEDDDEFVEETIVHEVRHVFQVLILGTMFWILFGIIFIIIKVFTKKNPYYNHPFEIDARAATQRWIDRGRPKIFTFGKRN